MVEMAQAAAVGELEAGAGAVAGSGAGAAAGGSGTFSVIGSGETAETAETFDTLPGSAQQPQGEAVRAASPEEAESSAADGMHADGETEQQQPQQPQQEISNTMLEQTAQTQPKQASQLQFQGPPLPQDDFHEAVQDFHEATPSKYVATSSLPEDFAKEQKEAAMLLYGEEEEDAPAEYEGQDGRYRQSKYAMPGSDEEIGASSSEYATEWIAYVDKTSGSPYFFNTRTGESSWTEPLNAEYTWADHDDDGVAVSDFPLVLVGSLCQPRSASFTCSIYVSSNKA